MQRATHQTRKNHRSPFFYSREKIVSLTWSLRYSRSEPMEQREKRENARFFFTSESRQRKNDVQVKRKTSFPFVFRTLNCTFNLRFKILSLGNEKEKQVFLLHFARLIVSLTWGLRYFRSEIKKTSFPFAFRSLNRIFNLRFKILSLGN